MTKKQKKTLARILVSAAMLIALHFLPVSGPLLFFLYLIPYGIIGYDILRKAWKGVLNRQVFDENFLMAVATLGAFAIGLLRTGGHQGEPPRHLIQRDFAKMVQHGLHSPPL